LGYLFNLVSGEFIDCEGSGLFKLQSCCKINYDE
jgi:hypothetical protein